MRGRTGPFAIEREIGVQVCLGDRGTAFGCVEEVDRGEFAGPKTRRRLRDREVGSGNAAHVNKFFCVPQVHFLGVTPQDVVDYKLPTHPLKDVDVKRARDALKNDPFIRHHKEWVQALKQMIEMGVRVEQQAFAMYGLNYVIEKYLPEKLRRPKKFLP